MRNMAACGSRFLKGGSPVSISTTVQPTLLNRKYLTWYKTIAQFQLLISTFKSWRKRSLKTATRNWFILLPSHCLPDFRQIFNASLKMPCLSSRNECRQRGGDILTRILAFVCSCVGPPEYIVYWTSNVHVQRKRSQNAIARFAFQRCLTVLEFPQFGVKNEFSSLQN